MKEKNTIQFTKNQRATYSVVFVVFEFSSEFLLRITKNIKVQIPLHTQMVRFRLPRETRKSSEQTDTTQPSKRQIRNQNITKQRIKKIASWRK
jgi:hypothetical protein